MSGDDQQEDRNDCAEALGVAAAELRQGHSVRVRVDEDGWEVAFAVPGKARRSSDV